MKELTQQVMGIEHHITLAYCPRANGSVEVVGRDLLWTLRALTSEFRISLDKWDLVLPLVQLLVNYHDKVVLGGRSTLEVMTGQKPLSTVNLAIWAGVILKDARKFVTKRELEAVRDLDEARRRRKALRTAGQHPGQNFNRGDYVMVA